MTRRTAPRWTLTVALSLLLAGLVAWLIALMSNSGSSGQTGLMVVLLNTAIIVGLIGLVAEIKARLRDTRK